MVVLVTGHKGYIGTVLVPLLLKQGHTVRGVDTDLYRRCTFTGALAPVESLEIDIRDIQKAHLADCEAVIHLAGLSNDPLGDFRPELTVDINERASIRLAAMAKEMGVRRFLFASSCSNYGAAGSSFLTEEAAFNPVTPYGLSKVRVETALREMADQDFSPTYIRASTAYGVSPRLRFDLVVNNLTAWAYTTGRVHLKSDGSPWRPLVHVEDIALAYIAALHAPRECIDNQAFNVGTTAENYQIKDVASLVEEIVPHAKIDFASDAGPDQRCYRVDCNKLARSLEGFKPQWTVRRGIEQLHRAYRQSDVTLEDFEGAKYKRIAHIQWLIAKGLLDENLRWNK